MRWLTRHGLWSMVSDIMTESDLSMGDMLGVLFSVSNYQGHL